MHVLLFVGFFIWEVEGINDYVVPRVVFNTVSIFCLGLVVLTWALST